MEYQSIRDIKLSGKTVLVRVDYNLPLKNGKITNDLRLRATLPTLKFLREQGAKKIILLSHLGRPQGRTKELSLKPVADRLAKLLPDVGFVDDVSGPDVESAVKRLKKGGILLLENLRFFAGEEKNSSAFIGEIVDSVGAELYVQDGFAVIHRAHASVSAISDHLPVYAGLLLEQELKNLQKILTTPAHPFLIILGGSKIADKQPLINHCLPLADHIVIGGKIAATGYRLDSPKVYVAEDFDQDVTGAKLDIGPLATAKIVELIASAQTILWNGLLGQAEDPAYATTSTIVAEAISRSTTAKTVICGGDTTGFVESLIAEGRPLKYSLISTGGGATLEYLAGKSLPGLEALEPKKPIA